MTEGISDEADADGSGCCGCVGALRLRRHGAGRIWRHAGGSEHCSGPGSGRTGCDAPAAHAADADVATQRPAAGGSNSSACYPACAHHAGNRRTVAYARPTGCASSTRPGDRRAVEDHPAACRASSRPGAERGMQRAQRVDPERDHGRRRDQLWSAPCAGAFGHELQGRGAAHLSHEEREFFVPVHEITGLDVPTITY